MAVERQSLLVFVAATFIEGLKMVPDVDAGVLRVTVTGRLLVDPLRIEATALDGQTKVASASGQAGLDISPAVRKNKVDTHGGIPPKDDKRLGITSEDGGWGVAAAGHCWSDKSWTYTTYDPETGASAPGLLGQGRTRKLPPLDDDSRRWMTRRVRGLFRSLWANKDQTGQSGDFYCQIVDVEDECNGLLSYDRAVFKVDPDVVRAACRGEEMPGKVVDLLPCAVAGPVTWRYTTARPAGDWFAPAFDDASWKEGAAGFGAGIAGVRTPWTASDIWLRKEFTLAEKPAGPLVRMFHDEDVEVYLNGVLACRETGFLTSYDYFDIDAKAAATLKPGKNVIAVHCRQTSGGQFIDVGIVVPQRADPGESKKEPRAAR
jgi:hypothetical protein